MPTAQEVRTKLQKLIQRYILRTGASNVVEAIAMSGQPIGELNNSNIDDTLQGRLFYIGTYRCSSGDTDRSLYISTISKVYYWKRVPSSKRTSPSR
jgi:hypothetical protein